MPEAADSAAPEATVPPRRMLRGPLRWLVLGLGWVCVGLALAGVVLPILPTTPLLLVAVWAFSMSSERMRTWLFEHPLLGPYLVDWDRERAIPMSAKATAVTLMALAWTAVTLQTDHIAATLGSAAVLLPVAIFVATRRLPTRMPPGLALPVRLVLAVLLVVAIGLGCAKLLDGFDAETAAIAAVLAGALVYVVSRPAPKAPPC